MTRIQEPHILSTEPDDALTRPDESPRSYPPPPDEAGPLPFKLGDKARRVSVLKSKQRRIYFKASTSTATLLHPFNAYQASVVASSKVFLIRLEPFDASSDLESKTRQNASSR